MEDLSHEFQFSDSDQSLLDLFGSALQKDDLIYQENCQFDFTAGHLIPEHLQEFGMKKDIFLSGLKSLFNWIHLCIQETSSQSEIKKNVKRNCSVVCKLLGNLEEERVNFKSLVTSPVNLVRKSNGSPRLIHNLKALNRFVKRGPSVKIKALKSCSTYKYRGDHYKNRPK